MAGGAPTRSRSPRNRPPTSRPPRMGTTCSGSSTKRSPSSSNASRRKIDPALVRHTVVSRYFPEFESARSGAASHPESATGAATAPRIIAPDVRALHRPGRRAVPARRAVAVRRAARAVRDRRVRLGRGLARRRRPARPLPRRPGVPRRPGARRRRRASRRPPRSSTCVGRRSCRRSTLPDTQPFDDPAGRFAFSHNGDLRDYRGAAGDLSRAGPDPRPGRHGGRRALARGRLARRRARRAPARRAPRPIRRPGQPGRARPPTATPHHYAGNGENPVFTFRLGRIGIASTGIYSLDRSLFRFVAPGATDRRLVRQRVTVSLDRNGNPLERVLTATGGRWKGAHRRRPPGEPNG